MPIYKENRANPNAIYFEESSLGWVYFEDKLVWQKTTAGLGYGLLYNWHAVKDIRNISPLGWHVPTQTEIEILSNYLGGYSVAGGKLKETGIVYWNDPNIDATNESGFNGRGAGARVPSGDLLEALFEGINSGAGWWTITESGSLSIYYFILQTDGILYEHSWYGVYVENSREIGYSVRLIKDDSSDEGTMTDNDGNIYPTVTIGTQVWMAANLKTTKYRTGDAIPEVTDNAAWAALTTGALCAYNNDWGNV